MLLKESINMHLLFRIEDINGFNPVTRVYQNEDINHSIIEAGKLNQYIAEEIRKCVNGSTNRSFLSYSKSLATCLLKYNKYTDNELHIFCPEAIDIIKFTWENGENSYIEEYNIHNWTNSKNYMQVNNKNIVLQGLIIDISDNKKLDKYLKHFTNTKLKPYASPEKDNEVIVYNPSNDFVIKKYINAVYLLYALQLKYGFLNCNYIREKLIEAIKNLEDFRFENCKDERENIILLIWYLSIWLKKEKNISKQIFDLYKKQPHLSAAYDSISEFNAVINEDFEDAYNLSFDDNVLSSLFWKYCYIYLYTYDHYSF